MADWRNGQNLAFLMIRFYNSQDFNSSTDVTFQLPDDSEVKAHKVILAVSSEVFHSQFFGPFADKTVNIVKVPDNFGSDTFRIMIESIYNSGIVPDLEVSEYLALLEAANFYLLGDVIDECNKKLSEHVKSLEVDELAEWSVQVSHLSIHDKLYESCREAILAKLSRIIKEDKWDNFSAQIRDILLVDIDNIEMWKGDLYHYLQVLKRLCFLEMNKLIPDTVIRFNSSILSFFESFEEFQEFMVRRLYSVIYLLGDLDGEESKAKIRNYFDSIKSKDSVMSRMYALLKGGGVDLEHQIEWDEDDFWFSEIEEYGVEWDKQEDRDHYWRLLEFSHLHQLHTLTSHCLIRLSFLMLSSFPKDLAQHISRATESPQGKDLFKLGIHVFGDATVNWRWWGKPYIDSPYDLTEANRNVVFNCWVQSWDSFNEKAIKSISDQLKSLEDSSHGAQAIRMGIRLWCNSQSSNAEEASKKFEMIVGVGVSTVSNNNGGT